MLVITKYDISFNNLNGEAVFIPAGSEIYVDKSNDSAYAAGCHFSISQNEYFVFNEAIVN